MEKKKQPVKEAAAIQYEPGESAPKIVALGKGSIAEKIIETAQENDIPIHQDPKLAQMLNLLKIGDEIPPELYEVVAQILIFVSDLDKLKSITKRD